MFRWTKTIWTAIGLGLALVIAQVSYGGNWPIEPSDQTHPIGNSGAELANGGSGFHYGIDIMEDHHWPDTNAHWVVTKDQGKVVSGNFTGCGTHCDMSLVAADGTTQKYIHLDELSFQTAIITAYMNGTILPAGTHVGKVVEWNGCTNHPGHDYYHHLHFEILDTTGRLEPVLWLSPNTDTDGPFIEDVWFTNNDFVGTLTALPQDGSSTIVQGKIDIIVKAFDRQFATFMQNHKTAVLKLQYTVKDSSANVVKVGRIIDLSIIPDDPYANVLYADDSPFHSSADYCTPKENYFYVVTNVDDNNSMPQTFKKDNSWDTTMHPNGTYQVVVTVWNGNSVSLVKQVMIKNLIVDPVADTAAPKAPSNLRIQ